MELRDEERTKCEVWSRVMGYLRPRQDYNLGKKQEHNDRKMFTEEKAMEVIGEVKNEEMVA